MWGVWVLSRGVMSGSVSGRVLIIGIGSLSRVGRV